MSRTKTNITTFVIFLLVSIEACWKFNLKTAWNKNRPKKRKLDKAHTKIISEFVLTQESYLKPYPKPFTTSLILPMSYVYTCRSNSEHSPAPSPHQAQDEGFQTAAEGGSLMPHLPLHSPTPKITTWENHVHPFSFQPFGSKHNFLDLEKSVSTFQPFGSKHKKKPIPWESSPSGTTRCSARQDWMIWAKVPTWSAPRRRRRGLPPNMEEISEFSACWPFGKEQADSRNPKKEQLWKIHQIHHTVIHLSYVIIQESYICHICHTFVIDWTTQAPIPASLHIFSTAWLDVESRHKRRSLGARLLGAWNFSRKNVSNCSIKMCRKC